MSGKRLKFFQALEKAAAEDTDQPEDRVKKATLLLFGILMSGGGLLWGVISLVFGLYIPSLIPFGYTIFVIIFMLLFVITKKYVIFSNLQLGFSLLLPFLFQWLLGGFANSGAVMLWAIIAPLSSQFFRGFRSAVFWFVGFMILTIASGILDASLPWKSFALPEYAQIPALTVNVALVNGIVFFTSLYFYTQLEEKRAALRDTLEQVNQLKKTQDGDYFLTSLLLNPLSANNVNSDHVSMDLLLSQKKKFEFRHWSSEIGGDYCLTESLELSGKSYSFFLNADAMGKSLQGASGILVLGSAMKAEFTQFKSIGELSKKSPEQWLMDLYSNLQSIFETFDGSMLISLVMGLLEEDSGRLYYLNVEHPWPVLYRNEKASFLREDDAMCRKLGMTGFNSPPGVCTFSMEPGDVLVLGSDGRDDIRLRDEKGEIGAAMNQDENLFLAAVEDAKGDLHVILDWLMDKGELTDDISLLLVAYHPANAIASPEEANGEKLSSLLTRVRGFIKEKRMDEARQALEAAEPIYRNNAVYLRELVSLYARLNDFSKLAKAAERYIGEVPQNTDYVYLASYAWKMMKQFQRSLPLAEKAYDFDPGNLKYLENLAEIRLNLNHFQEAETLIDKGLSLDPNSETLKILQKYLRKRIVALNPPE